MQKQFIPVILLLVIVGGWFMLYWFSLRPVNIRKDCSRFLVSTKDVSIIVQTDTEASGRAGRSASGGFGDTPEQAELKYMKCLAENGLQS